MTYFEVYKECKKLEVGIASATACSPLSDESFRAPGRWPRWPRPLPSARHQSWTRAATTASLLWQVETRLKRRQEAQKGGFFS